ncbi:hypothetical protein EMCG_00713 [[Emmonsia] crescens]|uniref:Uncharacterized protein n=1 Tax=[Emmonsia] crescens TaxID=73230 RepID=A0A0G2HQR4_9EURO|nr:hypothetical protein EMCG_00713 [Emmonsia crescens UAMH 3008]
MDYQTTGDWLISALRISSGSDSPCMPPVNGSHQITVWRLSLHQAADGDAESVLHSVSNSIVWMALDEDLLCQGVSATCYQVLWPLDASFAGPKSSHDAMTPFSRVAFSRGQGLSKLEAWEQGY